MKKAKSAMAALRYAARKLGDRALQRLQAIHTAAASTAAEEEGQRRLIRTVLPSSSRGAAKPPTRNTKHPCAKSAAEPLDEKRREYLVRSHLTQIQKKKEELFNLIAELDSKLPSRCTKDNRELLMDLSTQVEPKPNDPQWRWYRGAKRLNNFVIYGGALFLSYMSVSNHLPVLFSRRVD